MRVGASARGGGPAIGGQGRVVIVDVWREEGQDAAATARTSDIPRGLVHAAPGYYADQHAAVDGWIEGNSKLASKGKPF